MNNNSRTIKSLKNAQIALVFYFINLILQFFSRKIFIEYLGNEVLGLNTTAMNLLQFLNLAELGIGAAVSYSLYKPLANKNEQVINEIISVQGYLYRRIGYIVVGGAFLLICFFPLFFAKAQVPLWYTYATFGVLLIAALAGYFFNYKQILLTSDQKEYKLNYAIQSIRILKVILQILAIRFLSNGYIWWLGIEFTAVILTVIGINYVVKREYPWLNTNIMQGKQLIAKYSQITHKTKQLFFHKIAGYALSQTSPIIIYAYASLTLVAIYGNYILIIGGVTAFLGAIFNSMNAGIGNLVAEGNKQRIIEIFEELFSIRFFFLCIACFGIYKLTPAFITLWIGQEYLLDNVSLRLLIAIMYINISRLTVDSYINAYGLFKDIWAPITETIINIGMSIFLGYFWGLHGILGGVLLSLFIIVFCWKPYFLFHYGLKEQFKQYLLMYFKHIVAIVLTYCLSQYIISFFKQDPSLSIKSFIICGIIYTTVFSIILFLGLYILTQGMKRFYSKSKYFIKK